MSCIRHSAASEGPAGKPGGPLHSRQPQIQICSLGAKTHWRRNRFVLHPHKLNNLRHDIGDRSTSQGQTFKVQQYFKGSLLFYNAGQYVKFTHLKL